MELEFSTDTTAPTPAPDLSALLIRLLKGVLYRDNDERQWTAMLHLQARVRDYAAILNLDLMLDEAEGYAFFKSRTGSPEDDSGSGLPRLVARRPLSFPVSLLLALLRKKLAEFDAAGGDTRLVLSRDDMVELMRIFLPDGTNEARVIDRIDSTINKIIDLGFLYELKPSGTGIPSPTGYEVRRILKAFIDAQWLSEFDQRLALYQIALSTNKGKQEGDHE